MYETYTASILEARTSRILAELRDFKTGDLCLVIYGYPNGDSQYSFGEFYVEQGTLLLDSEEELLLPLPEDESLSREWKDVVTVLPLSGELWGKHLQGRIGVL